MVHYRAIFDMKIKHEDGGSMIVRNIDILPHYHTASQPRRPSTQKFITVLATVCL